MNGASAAGSIVVGSKPRDPKPALLTATSLPPLQSADTLVRTLASVSSLLATRLVLSLEPRVLK